MNNDLERLSEERLIELSRFKQASELAALARIALSAKQAKPVGYAVNNVFFRQYMTASLYSCEMKHPIETFYITPQPAHTEQANPVAWLLSGGGTKNIVSFDSSNAYADPLREVIPLYTNQQTNHARCVSWIKCSERMPETYLNVLLTDEADDMCIGQLESHDDTDFFVVGCPRYKATHWMPLPAAPKPESE